jgi:hypothetical protein
MGQAANSDDPIYAGISDHEVPVQNQDIDLHPWRNPVHPCDVHADWIISAADLLRLISDINANGARELGVPGTSAPEPPPYLDSSGDDVIAAVDLLVVIEFLHRNGSVIIDGQPSRPAAGEGEFDSAAIPVARFATLWLSDHLAQDHLAARQRNLGSTGPTSLVFDSLDPGGVRRDVAVDDFFRRFPDDEIDCQCVGASEESRSDRD